MYPLDVGSLMYLRGFQVGDKLRVPIALGVFHYGIYIGDDGYVVHNDKGGGVRLVRFDEFAQGRPVEVEARVPWHAQAAARDEALRWIGTPYDIAQFNCEHFANLVQTGKAESAQVRNIVGLAILVGLVVLAARTG